MCKLLEVSHVTCLLKDWSPACQLRLLMSDKWNVSCRFWAMCLSGKRLWPKSYFGCTVISSKRKRKRFLYILKIQCYKYPTVIRINIIECICCLEGQEERDLSWLSLSSKVGIVSPFSQKRCISCSAINSIPFMNRFHWSTRLVINNQ